jgi:hypothetical protein
MKRCGTAGTGHRMGNSCPGSEILLKGTDLRPQGNAPGAERFYHRLDIIFENLGTRKGYLHRRVTSHKLERPEGFSRLEYVCTEEALVFGRHYTIAGRKGWVRSCVSTRFVFRESRKFPHSVYLCRALYQQFEGKGKIFCSFFSESSSGSYPQSIHHISTKISTYIVAFFDQTPYIVLKSLGRSAHF